MLYPPELRDRNQFQVYQFAPMSTLTLLFEKKCSCHTNLSDTELYRTNRLVCPKRTRGMMKILSTCAMLISAAICLNAADSKVDIYTPKDLKAVGEKISKKGGQFV